MMKLLERLAEDINGLESTTETEMTKPSIVGHRAASGKNSFPASGSLKKVMLGSVLSVPDPSVLQRSVTFSSNSSSVPDSSGPRVERVTTLYSSQQATEPVKRGLDPDRKPSPLVVEYTSFVCDHVAAFIADLFVMFNELVEATPTLATNSSFSAYFDANSPAAGRRASTDASAPLARTQSLSQAFLDESRSTRGALRLAEA